MKENKTTTDELKIYTEGLARFAADYIDEIRVKIASKALEMYQDATFRRLVLAYAAEAEKLDRERLRAFASAMQSPEIREYGLKDSPLNNAEHYAAAIKLLIGF